MNDAITARAFHQAEGLEDWRVLGEGACIFFRTASFAESVRLVQAIRDIPGIEDHPPAADIRAGGVTVRLISVADDYFGMTQRDVHVARRISAVGRELGLSADPSGVQYLLVIPGAPDVSGVMPFWRAVLGYEPRPDSPDEDLVDPQDRGPAFWVESMDEPRLGPARPGRGPPRGRPLPPAVASCATTSRPRGGPWPTQPATRRTSPPRRAATDRGPSGEGLRTARLPPGQATRRGSQVPPERPWSPRG